MTPYSSVQLDPYVELNVPRNASPNDIKQAYRRIALASHPDRHGGDPAYAERFRRASQSYALLRDPERRLRFDRTGRWDDGLDASGLDEQLMEALEIFARDFGGTLDLSVTEDRAPAHTGRVTLKVDVSYEDVERGARRRMPTPCPQCSGSGAREGSAHVRCTSCGGSGRLRQVETSLLGPRIHTQRCDGCHGSGRRPIVACPGCAGSGRAAGAGMVDVIIPRGAADGDPLITKADSNYRLIARLVEDQRWARDGADLYATKRIPYEVAVLGGSTEVELPGRLHTVRVAPATASGHRLRIPQQGLPLRDGSGRGDLLLTVHVAVPERVGGLERWLLKLRAGRAAPVDAANAAGRLGRLQARARQAAEAQWQRWQAYLRDASLARVESTASSLHAAAKRLTDSEQRLGPLLERAFPLIAPEAARARGRLAGTDKRNRFAAISQFSVDAMLAAALCTGLWLLARFAAPAVTATGRDPWWDIFRGLPPVLLAIVPLAAGLASGLLRSRAPQRRLQLGAGVPIGLAVGAAAAATGTAAFASIMALAPGADAFLLVTMSSVAAAIAGFMSLFLFVVGDFTVDSARMAVQELRSISDQRALRKYDHVARLVANHLERTERAFRQLLTQAEDARHPLASLLDTAADALAADGGRRVRAADPHAAVALVAGVLVAGLWLATTALTAVLAFSITAAAPMPVSFASAGLVIATCALGLLLPPELLERQRVQAATTALAGAGAIASLTGALVSGFQVGWLAAGGAVAALALSFRMREALRATVAAAVIIPSGIVALLLYPISAIRSGQTS